MSPSKEVNTFSIIIPCYSGEINTDIHDRSKTVQRAIKSIMNQQYPNWELIVVDDGAVDNTPKILDRIAEEWNSRQGWEQIRIIHQKNEGRVIARNAGMAAARFDWLCWLDSDDEYVTHYLRELDQAIKDFPEYKMFNFGSICYFSDHHSTIRSTFHPLTKREALTYSPEQLTEANLRPEDAADEDGHVWFRPGHIGAGSFIFRKDLWESDPSVKIPDSVNPYQLAADSKYPMRWDSTEPDRGEGIENAFQDGVYRHGSSLGNPWGDDFLQFYNLTRKYESKPLDVILYVQYVRAHEDVYSNFGEIFDPRDFEVKADA